MSSLEDKKTRAMLEAATSPVSIVPFLAGSTGCIAMFAVGVTPVLGVVAAAGAVAWGIGSALVRAMSSDSIREKVERDILVEKEQESAERIKKLRQKLETSEEALLDEILGLQRLIQSASSTDPTQSDVLSTVKDLLEQSLNILFRVPMLNDLEDTVRSGKKALQVVREQKIKILDSAKANIEFVTKIIAEFNSLGTGGGSQEEIRKQLSLRLDTAKEFDGQLSALQLGGISPELIAEYSKAG